jgi:hypothetical protein
VTVRPERVILAKTICSDVIALQYQNFTVFHDNTTEKKINNADYRLAGKANPAMQAARD